MKPVFLGHGWVACSSELGARGLDGGESTGTRYRESWARDRQGPIQSKLRAYKELGPDI